MRLPRKALIAPVAILGLGSALIGTTPAHADQPVSLVGVGSDTVQDVFNAFAGYANGKEYTALHSSNGTTLSTWDAIDPAAPTATTSCITPKGGFASVDRPNGSGDGQKALSRALDGGAWSKGYGCDGNTSGNAGDVTGSVDFARSSSGPGTQTGTQLTFVPFARDGVSYLYVGGSAAAASDVGALTSGNLRSLYGTGGVSTSGIITVGSTTVYACMVQPGSGTGKFWDKAMGNTAANGVTSNASAVASGCNTTAGTGTTVPYYEENGANSFAAAPFMAALTATQAAVIPFSAGSYISQLNGVAVDRSSSAVGTKVGLGSTDGVSPSTGTAPTLSPNSAYYSSTTYGRDLFVVVPTSKKNQAVYKSLFSSTTSAICSSSAVATSLKFGFSTPAATCGNTTLTQGYA